MSDSIQRIFFLNSQLNCIATNNAPTGYLSTVDEYYESNVRHILTTVVAELEKNPERKFTYVEIAFFQMWWQVSIC